MPSTAAASSIADARSSANTCAPLCASRAAVAAPKPDAPPVTIAAVPDSSISFLLVTRSVAPVAGCGQMLSGQMSGDDHTLNLIRAFEYLHDFRFAHIAFHREVGGITGTPEDLYRVGGDLHRVIGAHEFGNGGLPAERPARVP